MCFDLNSEAETKEKTVHSYRRKRKKKCHSFSIFYLPFFYVIYISIICTLVNLA